MILSIRNRFTGIITEIVSGSVMGTVTMEIPGGQSLAATVTMDAIKDLGIGIGTAVEALIKSTDIAVATTEVSGLSIRNKLAGTLVGLDSGGAMSVARIKVGKDVELTAAITRAAAEELKLEPGTPVTALIKSTEVSFSAV
ncbi:TOBE domain-containing protein [Frankia torreyi]|uniref:TOBE domain-containing protein n=1 Tax=Frankia torreyi TaxID=1856 RepID=A0A0D8BBY0_9ACTN|nr:MULTISPECIES: TOBE domain-containing protein [Frankia]KJE21459.1 TOBE domain-containing protein [Frankia torreyi]KQC38830.1 adenylate kinase [Frankia sp. ACN1ag]